MKDLEIHVYDDNGKLVKTCTSESLKLKFGAVRSLMELLNIESIDNTVELLRMVYGVWDQLTEVLTRCFPEMTYEDWDNVQVSELIPVLMNMFRDFFQELMRVPNDSKN